MATCPSCGASVSSGTLESGACPYCDTAVRAVDDEFGDRVFEVTEKIGEKIDALGEAITEGLRDSRKESPTSSDYLNDNDYTPVLRLDDGSEIHAKGDYYVHFFRREPGGAQHEISEEVFMRVIEGETAPQWVGGYVRCSHCESRYHFTRGLGSDPRGLAPFQIQCPECRRRGAIASSKRHRAYADQERERHPGKRMKGIFRRHGAELKEGSPSMSKQDRFAAGFLQAAEAIGAADIEQPLMSMAGIEEWIGFAYLAKHGSKPPG